MLHSKILPQTSKNIYTDISAISVTFRNSDRIWGAVLPSGLNSSSAAQCILFAQCLATAQCILYAQCIVTAHCTLHIVHCTLYIVCTLHIAHCILHIAHCTLYSQCIVTAHCNCSSCCWLAKQVVAKRRRCNQCAIGRVRLQLLL